MKILYLVHQYLPDSIGGTEVVLHDLALSMADWQHEVAIFVYHESGSANPAAYGIRREEIDGIQVYRFHFNFSLHPQLAEGEFRNGFSEQALREVIADFRPDVAHVMHAMKLGGGVFEILDEAGIPMVSTLSDYWYFCLRHSLLLPDGSACSSGPRPASNCLPCLKHLLDADDGEEEALARALEQRNHFLRESLLRSRRIFSLSPHQRAQYLSQGFPADRIELAVHGVNESSLERARANHEREPERGEGQPLRLLFVGTLLPHKGVDRVLRAVLSSPETPVQLRIVGDPGKGGEYGAEMEQLSRGDTRIEWVGECEHRYLEDHYAWCDFLVMPSLWDENEPLVVKEARWCGIPVAVHDLPGLGDGFRDGVDGWVLPDRTVEGWIDWLSRAQSVKNRFLPPGEAPPTCRSFAETMLAAYEDTRVQP